MAHASTRTDAWTRRKATTTKAPTTATASSAEHLEGRRLFATFTWAGGAGEWASPSSWVGNAVPTQEDDVVVPTGSTVNITRDGSGNPYTANSATLTIAAGTTVNLESGSYLNTDLGGTIAGTFNWGGVLSSGAETGQPLVLSGTTTESATGVASTTGAGLITNTGTIAFTGGSGVDDGTFTNAGTATVTGGLALSGTYVNAAGGTTTLTDDDGFLPETGNNGAYRYFGSFKNLGTLVKSGGTGTSNFPDLSAVPAGTLGSTGEFESLGGGTIRIASGSLAIHDNLELGDTTLNVAPGSTFQTDLNAGDTAGYYAIAVAGTVTGTGGGTVEFNEGQFTSRLLDSSDAATTATLNFPVGMAQVTAASFTTYSTTPITNAGYLDFAGSAAHGAVQLTNDGTLRVTGSADVPLTVVTNDATGVIDLQTDAGLSSATGNVADNLLNSGTVRKSAGTGTSTIGASLSDTGGTIDVESGTVALGTDSRQLLTNPVVTVATGAALDLTTTGVTYVQGTLSATGGGTVRLTAGTLSGPRADAGQDATHPGTLAFAAGVFTVAGGVIDGSNFPLVNTGAIAYAGANAIDDFTNQGTMTIDAGPTDFAQSFLNDVGGTIDFTADQTVTGTPNGFMTNKGTIIKSAGTGTLSLAGYAVTSTGTIEVAAGTLVLDGGNRGFLDYQGGTDYDLAAGQTLKVDAGATLDIDTPKTVISNSATVILGGAGATIPFLAALATNAGTLAVLSGAAFTTAGDLTNTGTLTVGGQVAVTGALAQTGTLGFAVAAAAGTSGAPLLTVAGATSLAGELQVGVTSDQTVAAGTTYTVATFATPATGAFASTDATDFAPTVTPASIVLNSTSTGNPTPTPTPTGTLAPAFVRSTLLADVVGTVRHAGKVTVSVANTTSAVSKGKDTVSLYATTTGAIDGSSLVLSTITRQLTFKANQAKVFTLPVQTQNLPAGTYRLLMRTTDPTGLLTTVATGQTLVVEPPVVTLSATVAAVSPAAPKAGRKASVVVSLSNTGNIDSNAPLAVTIGLSIDGSTTVAVPITSATYKAHVKANGKPAKLKVSFTVPTGLGAVAYSPVVTVAGTVTTPATAGATAVGPSFTPAG